MIWWDAGTYRLADDRTLILSTATDELVEYPVQLTSQRFTFTDPEGCEVTYERTTSPPPSPSGSIPEGRMTCPMVTIREICPVRTRSVCCRQPGVPVAAPIAFDTQEPEGDTPQIPGPDPAPEFPRSRAPAPALRPPFKPCNLGFRDGCYAVTFRPKGSLRPLVGTLRIDRGAPEAGPDGVIVSGDLYLGAPPWVVHPDATATAGSVAATLSRGDPPFELLPIQRIPIYPRNRYHSYLSGTRLFVPAFTIGNRPCQVTIDVDQYDYTQPPAGSFEKFFPGVAEPEPALRRAPGLATVPPAGHRRASLPGPRVPGNRGPRIDHVDLGLVVPAPCRPGDRRTHRSGCTGSVPHPSGTGTEYFDTVFAGARWDLTVVEDQIDVRCRQVWIRTSAGQAATSTT